HPIPGRRGGRRLPPLAAEPLLLPPGAGSPPGRERLPGLPHPPLAERAAGRRTAAAVHRRPGPSVGQGLPHRQKNPAYFHRGLSGQGPHSRLFVLYRIHPAGMDAFSKKEDFSCPALPSSPPGAVPSGFPTRISGLSAASPFWPTPSKPPCAAACL